MNIRRLLIAAALPAMLAASTAYAAGPQVHLRGEVDSVDATQVVVKAADGSSTTVKLTDKSKVLDVSKTSLDAVADNSYIGVAGVSSSGGKVRALGVMVFPEAARGMNPGQFPWDIKKTSSMTNATVSKLVKRAGGAEIQVKFGEKTQTIEVDKATTFGTFVPGAPTLIVKGAKVLVFAEPGEGGAPTAGVVMVGRDGFLPPI